ncbi:Rpn family recombination-promoting nuclease/putative transposase [Paenibacillus macerans]|uniref:Transposase n=1 Tax=Paenibacillus macerans TaxID=44252 RepID=A0A6N8F2I0_PAEMA|nr:Rpn family recombination-promoting nuclease/putative transposase [Paenibacillus macerans]MBS5913645.1 Rpn family recombination-promoting nuclease/putative transposase [Paenibacillus macerans]MEC0136665.1 Rpn family recombination-promoting nuclease/putative transposase [Paenibacillus macerans]MUG24841.1 transposase [Paenibacillus macerans]UMV49287.1 Rpn family recombination-promoting nuclease/putative transposase [Paenibacillus macerans]GBK63787.1 transposase [Paenibacillus macerans]
MNAHAQEVREKPFAPDYRKDHIPHDEAFKKLLQTFFAEFIALFFPELDKLLDHRQTRFLMQEQLVDLVGEEARTLDLLLETKYITTDAFILIHLEPQSYKQPDFHERMFIYFSRLFERHRKEHKLIIPIAVFTGDSMHDERNSLSMDIPGQEILHFQFLKVELQNHHWRKFVDSNNPVAAALLAKMGYNRGEEREMRLAYLRMILQLRKRLDSARIKLIMSFADLYFVPDPKQDEAMLYELTNQYPEEREAIMELMPAWMRLGYEKGREEGVQTERQNIALRLIAKGFSLEEVAETIKLPIEEVRKLKNS